MALYHKWDVKNAYVLQFFSLISDGLGGVFSYFLFSFFSFFVQKNGLKKIAMYKGQLISECLFEKIIWTKIPTKNLILAQQV